MRTFLVSMAILGALEVVTTLIRLSRGSVPERTPGSMALNAVVMACLGLWAAYLLVTL